MKRIIGCILAITLLFSGCNLSVSEEKSIEINLSDSIITVDGVEITSDSTQAVYSANDIVFYLANQPFTYGEGTEKDGHEQSEADAHTVVHITKPGKYILSGTLSLGQVAVDLGEDAKDDPNAVVTLILNGVDITCEVAPAVIFYNVYECSESDAETATKDVDTSKAGANVIIADGTENNINGSYVAKIYKSYELSEDGTEVIDSKKLHKYDGAFYSKRTMNIYGGDKGDGILNIYAENEGLDSELHLTINGGIINITSGNDGINTNEDYVSVTTVNGGVLNILCDGSTGEGDGIDSNGWLVINGGSVTAQGCGISGDAGIDSDMGIYLNGGNVVASGNMLDRIAGGNATYAVFTFANRQDGNAVYTLKNSDGDIVGEYAPKNAFTYLVVAGDELTPGEYTLWQGETKLSAVKNEMPMGGNPPMFNDKMPNLPDGERPDTPHGEMPNLPDGERPEFPEGERPEFPDGERPPMPEMPNLPDGMENMTPPNNRGGKMGVNIPIGVVSDVFTITEGGNHFIGVTPMEQ